MLFVGGSRAHHYQELFREIGMEIIAAGYEFAHRDDYEGRRVLPGHQGGRRQPQHRGTARRSRTRSATAPGRMPPSIARLEQEGITLSDYEGMMAEMKTGALVIDDISQYETEKLIEIYRPDIICAGIKEKYVIQKRGVPMQAAAQLRLRRTVCRLSGRDQLLPGNRPHGQQQGLEVPEGALAGESRTGRQVRLGIMRSGSKREIRQT